MKDCNGEVRGYEREEIRMSQDERSEILERAKINRKRIRKALKESGDPAPIGSRTQGSYAMRTMIRYGDGDYDIDDGLYFSRESLKDNDGNDMPPADARAMVCRAAVHPAFNDPPESRDNCVRVYYNEGYHIDVPVYRELEELDGLGNAKKTYELAATAWKQSDPIANTAWFKEQNWSRSSDASSNGNEGQLVRVVRLLKAFSRSRTNWCNQTTTGFSIAKLVCDTFTEGAGRDDKTFRDLATAVVARLKNDETVRHPILNENITERGDARIKFFCEKLDENLTHLSALDEPDCKHADAMKAWDKFFNTDWFSKQPDPDDEDELEKISSAAIIKRGETRYA